MIMLINLVLVVRDYHGAEHRRTPNHEGRHGGNAPILWGGTVAGS